MTCRLKINYHADREKIISGMANSGYKVWVEEVKEPNFPNNTIDYLVCFEIEPVKENKQ